MQSSASLSSVKTAANNIENTGSGLFLGNPIKVGRVRIKDYELGYEIHGHQRGNPVVRVLCVIGLLTSMSAYDRMIAAILSSSSSKDFDYQFLVFDNRGIGESTQGSFAWMTTSGLAKDAMTVLEHAGWTEERSVHLMGISMGGMISLELASMSSSYFKSLTLIVTGATSRSPRSNRSVALSLLKGGKTVDERIENMMDIVFSDQDFLNSSNLQDPRFPHCKTNRELMFETLKWRAEATKRPSLKTFIGQLLACMSHKVSPRRLKEIGEAIPDMLCIGALADKLVDPELSKEIAKHSGCKLVEFQGKGHLVVVEAEQAVLDEVMNIILAGEERWK